MRHCFNDVPEVYTASHKTMTGLTEEIAKWLPTVEVDGSWINMTVASDHDDLGTPIYTATIYVH